MYRDYNNTAGQRPLRDSRSPKRDIASYVPRVQPVTFTNHRSMDVGLAQAEARLAMHKYSYANRPRHSPLRDVSGDKYSQYRIGRGLATDIGRPIVNTDQKKDTYESRFMNHRHTSTTYKATAADTNQASSYKRNDSPLRRGKSPIQDFAHVRSPRMGRPMSYAASVVNLEKPVDLYTYSRPTGLGYAPRESPLRQSQSPSRRSTGILLDIRERQLEFDLQM